MKIAPDEHFWQVCGEWNDRECGSLSAQLKSIKYIFFNWHKAF